MGDAGKPLCSVDLVMGAEVEQGDQVACPVEDDPTVVRVAARPTVAAFELVRPKARIAWVQGEQAQRAAQCALLVQRELASAALEASGGSKAHFPRWPDPTP